MVVLSIEAKPRQPEKMTDVAVVPGTAGEPVRTLV
jgi:hypothetical protein